MLHLPWVIYSIADSIEEASQEVTKTIKTWLWVIRWPRMCRRGGVHSILYRTQYNGVPTNTTDLHTSLWFSLAGSFLQVQRGRPQRQIIREKDPGECWKQSERCPLRTCNENVCKQSKAPYSWIICCFLGRAFISNAYESRELSFNTAKRDVKFSCHLDHNYISRTPSKVRTKPLTV